jgi:tRNA A22 N-methylase
VPVTISEEYLRAVTANALIYGENLANFKKDASAQYYAQCANEVQKALKKIVRPAIPIRITIEPSEHDHNTNE